MKTPTKYKENVPEKNWFVALLLSIFVGGFGVDRFYLGCIGTGILKLITFGGFGIWAFIDMIRLALGDKLCGGFKWDTTHGAFKGGADVKLSDTVFIVIGLVLGLTMMYFVGYEFAMRKYREYVARNEAESATTT